MTDPVVANPPPPPAPVTTPAAMPDWTSLQQDWLKRHAAPPSLLHHYTTADGLLGLLKSKRLWATHAAFLNDPSELRYAAQLIGEVLEEAIPLDEKEAEGGFLSRFVTTLLKGQSAKAWISELVSASRDRAEVYLACFCQNGDLLSQWRGYGGAGDGYSVGFAGRLIASPAVASETNPVILRKVIYDPPTQKRIIQTWVDKLHELSESVPRAKDFFEFLRIKAAQVRAGTPPPPEALRDEMQKRTEEAALARQRLEECRAAFKQFLTECLVCYKDPAFKEEQEWRVIQFGTAGREVKFRTRKGHLIPFVELDLTRPDGEFAGRFPLRRITFGPTLDPATTKPALSLLAGAHGYTKPAVEIHQSRIPFRG